MVNFDKAQVKAELGNTAKLAAVNETSAAYATTAISTVLWLGRQVANLSVEGVKQKINTIKNNSTDAEGFSFDAIKTSAVGMITAVAQGVTNVFTSASGLGTCVAALSDTAIERCFDLAQHYTKKTVSKNVREPVKVLAAGSVYYAAGVTTLAAAPLAATTYAAYRVASHFANKYFEKVKAA